MGSEVGSRDAASVWSHFCSKTGASLRDVVAMVTMMRRWLKNVAMRKKHAVGTLDRKIQLLLVTAEMSCARSHGLRWQATKQQQTWSTCRTARQGCLIH